MLETIAVALAVLAIFLGGFLSGLITARRIIDEAWRMTDD